MKSPIILRIFKGDQLVEVKQFDKDQVIFGNGGEVDVALVDSGVSPIHCLIELRDSGYYIADLGSTSGTTKKGTAILDEPLSSGDQIGIGPFTINFFVGVPKPKDPPPPAAEKPKAKAEKTSEKTRPTTAEPPKIETHSASGPSLPKIKAEIPKSMSKIPRKSKKTFAPPSEIVDLKKYLKPTKGPVLEVIVAWKERIISSQHFAFQKSLTLGPRGDADVTIPAAFLKDKMIFADMSQGTRIFLAPGMIPEVMQAEKKYDQDMLASLGKANKGPSGIAVRVDQGELLAISIADGTIQIFVRHVPATAVPGLVGFDLTSGEITGVIVSFVIVALMALYVSVYTPPDVPPDKTEDQIKIAKFIYAEKTPPPPPPEPAPAPTPLPTPPPPKQKPVEVKVTKQEHEAKTQPKPNAAVKDNKASKAAEVRANNNKNNRKVFTSAVDIGAAVKTSNKLNSSAKAKPDPNASGLLGILATGGVAKNLKAAAGNSDGVIGEGTHATGSSGQNKNRAGEDIGGQFKNTGAGGKGVATQGIAGIGTKRDSNGTTKYGSLGNSTGKSNVAIEAAGAGAEFVGTVDREAVRRVVRSIYSQIKDCFDRELIRDSSLEGKIVIHWQVVEQGHVTISRPKEAPKDLLKVAYCVAERIKEQRFPEPPGGTFYEVDFPFLMSRQN